MVGVQINQRSHCFRPMDEEIYVHACVVHRVNHADNAVEGDNFPGHASVGKTSETVREHGTHDQSTSIEAVAPPVMFAELLI